MKHSLLTLSTAVATLITGATVQAQTTVSFGLRAGINLASRSGDDPKFILPAPPANPGSSPVVTNTYQQDYTRSAIFAPQFGAVLDVRFGKLALQPAVLFSQKGVEQELIETGTTTYTYTPSQPYQSSSKTTYHTTSRVNYIEIPLNLVYTSGGDHGFQVFAGPYIAFGVGGRAELEYESRTTSTNSNGNRYDYSYGNTFFVFRDAYPGPAADTPNIGVAPFEASSGSIVARRLDAGINAGIGYRFRMLQLQLGYGLGLLNQQPGNAPTFIREMPEYTQRVAQLTATYFFSPLNLNKK